MSEHEKQLSGEWYNSNVPEIVELQKKSRLLMREFNAELDRDKRFNIMKKWFKYVKTIKELYSTKFVFRDQDDSASEKNSEELKK